jgi:hypothetical protein
MFTINTECGIMRDIDASTVEDAKVVYSHEYNFDFDGVEDYPGSWYWIEEDGVKIESGGEQ